MINPKVFREISKGILKCLNETCDDDTRYLLIAWSDDAHGPTYVGGNDENMPRVLKMLAMASHTVETMEGIESGTA